MPSNLWDEILARVEAKVSRYIFRKWFKLTTLVGSTDDALTVRVPNDHVKGWLEKHYMGHIEEAAKEVGRPEIDVLLVTSDGPTGTAEAGRPRIDDIMPATPDDPTGTAPAAMATPEVPTPQSVAGAVGGWTVAGATPEAPAPRSAPRQHPQRYTFGEFVVGPSNLFAHAAALAVAEAPARSYNPLFIHGGAGLGKTHLMHAIGDYIEIHSPQSTRTYISSERFMNEMINAIRFDRTLDFRKRYRSTDVLLVDDIQFLANREATQNEFFHTFNSLHDAHKQIVISSDCPPRELQFLDDRLRSRFEWGLTVDIQPPDFETRVAILKKKAEHLAPAIPIDDGVALYIAERVPSNIRELEGSLTTLIARASISGRGITVPLAQEVLPNLGEQDRPAITIEIIKRHVANHYSLKLGDLTSRSNAQTIVRPRQIAMYLARKLTKSSYPEIARKFNKHYSTVIYAVNQIEGRCKKDANFNSLINNFIRSIRESVGQKSAP